MGGGVPRKEPAFPAGESLIFGGACASLYRVNPALLTSSFFARAAAVSKLILDTLESVLGVAALMPVLDLDEPDEKSRPEPAV